MLETLIEWDHAAFLFLNSFHSEFLDPIMYFLTQTKPWIPLYLFLTYLIWKTYGKSSWWVFVAIGLTILFADQFTSTFMKPFFARLRPCYDPDFIDIIHHYGNCSSRYGFASSHAANSFAIATLMYLVLEVKYPQIKWLFPWAVLFSYTRIYLGVHFTGDVVVGALVGIISAFLAYYIALFIFKKLSPQIKENQ